MRNFVCNEKDLLTYLQKHIHDSVENTISMKSFDSYGDKPATSRTYIRMFGTWKKAIYAARSMDVDINTDTEQKSCSPDDVNGSSNPEVQKQDEMIHILAVDHNIQLARHKIAIGDLQRENTALRKKVIASEGNLQRSIELLKLPFDVDRINDMDTNGARSGLSSKNESHAGTLSVMLSDWHYGEYVDPDQIHGLNKMTTMDDYTARVQTLYGNIHKIVTRYLPKIDNELNLLLAGDMVNGDIHEELTATNISPIMPIVLRTYEDLVWIITNLAKLFDAVNVYCVAGNHARTTTKIPAKNFCYTSYDWLIYKYIEKVFAGSKVNINVSDGYTQRFKVAGYQYLLTHGCEFGGGQGFIGVDAPMIRGEMKKRVAHTTQGIPYDYLAMGHFHQYKMLSRVIANGSLIGYNEYAMRGSFPYEVPVQAGWITHPEHGRTFTFPLFCT
jgi:hypothetical protein